MAVFADDNGSFVEMDASRMLVPRSRFGNGFTLTTHRLQGSQANIVVYICVDDRWYINWRFLYTAFTRARQRVIILSTNTVFNGLLRRRAPRRRSALWYELLKSTTSVLVKHRTSQAAADAWRQFPMLLDLMRVQSEQQWAILENARYRTDRK
jgi:superfamily I DNA and RNA helicase